MIELNSQTKITKSISRKMNISNLECVQHGPTLRCLYARLGGERWKTRGGKTTGGKTRGGKTRGGNRNLSNLVSSLGKIMSGVAFKSSDFFILELCVGDIQLK